MMHCSVRIQQTQKCPKLTYKVPTTTSAKIPYWQWLVTSLVIVNLIFLPIYMPTTFTFIPQQAPVQHLYNFNIHTNLNPNSHTRFFQKNNWTNMKFVMAWEQLSPHMQKFKHSIMYNRLVPTGNQMWNLFDGKDVQIYIYICVCVLLLQSFYCMGLRVWQIKRSSMHPICVA